MTKFSDVYQDAGGGNWVGKEEKAELINDGVVLPLLKLGKGNSKFGERFVATVELDGEERSISFPIGTVESRDRQLEAMVDFLASDDAEPISFKLVKSGNSILVEVVE